MGRLGAMQRFASRCSWTVVVALVARILLVAARASSVVTHEAGEKVEHRTGWALRAALSAGQDVFSPYGRGWGCGNGTLPGQQTSLRFMNSTLYCFRFHRTNVLDPLLSAVRAHLQSQRAGANSLGHAEEQRMSAARTARTELRVLILFIVLALAQAGVRPHSAPCRVCSFSCRFPGFGAVFVTVVFCITICISW